MQDYFFALADALQAQLQGGETLLLSFDGEDSDFIRFNQARVRQAGSVTRRSLALDLIAADRHAAGRAQLAGSNSAPATVTGVEVGVVDVEAPSSPPVASASPKATRPATSSSRPCSPTSPTT